MRYAALAGLAMAWAAFCDPYFAVFCVMMAGLYVSSLLLLDHAAPAAPRRCHGRGCWICSILLAAGLVLGLAFGRGGRLELLGVQVSVRGLYTPVLVLTILVLVRVALLFRAQLASASQRVVDLEVRGHRGHRLRRAAVAGAVRARRRGSSTANSSARRCSGAAARAEWTCWPSCTRIPIIPSRSGCRAMARPTAPVAFVEYTAAFSFVAIGIVVAGLLWARYRPKPSWWWLTLGFTALSLGPFVIVAGTNTYVPGPWALLRYVPVINAVRTPTRFAIVAALGLAMLMAGALAALGRTMAASTTRHRMGRAWFCSCASWLPAPRTLYSGEYSPLSDVMAADPRPVRVLDLPFGVRDGRSSAGDFSARYQFEQTRHGKPLIGGYLSRVSQRRLVSMIERFPPLGPLVAMSEGRSLSDADAARFVSEGRAFVSAANVGYVVIDVDARHRPSCGCSRSRRSGSRPSPWTGRTRSIAPTTCANLAVMRRGPFLLLFALSGAAALVYEVVWTRLLALQVGHGLAAASTVLAAFMGGLAIGAAAGGRIGQRMDPRRRCAATLSSKPASRPSRSLCRVSSRALRPVLAALYDNGAGGLAFSARAACLEPRPAVPAGGRDGRHLPAGLAVAGASAPRRAGRGRPAVRRQHPRRRGGRRRSPDSCCCPRSG